MAKKRAKKYEAKLQVKETVTFEDIIKVAISGKNRGKTGKKQASKK